MPTYLTLSESAQYLKVSVKTIYRRIDEGVFTAYRLPGGRGVRLIKEEIDEAMKGESPREEG